MYYHVRIYICVLVGVDFGPPWGILGGRGGPTCPPTPFAGRGPDPAVEGTPLTA